ncbi:hypothetical protein EDE15_4404 [Edaphobacter aggregans]|uniref:DUF4136 domain-containing protein n=1 Tax=Edaphobacter aggregans TaxID=570835 RepID=A0A428MPJ0_9BACT|nr:hypothetical protein [Edaphobacter aggregans]RSL18802.1 hypothetical protein EDE15_4404 [Edaphobacter aggregans]
MNRLLAALFLPLLSAPLVSQSAPVTPAILAPKPAPEPTTPAARPFRDNRYGVSIQIPTAWNLSRRDGDLSTYNLDARTASRSAQLRAVANIAFNPYPTSTFSGALFYFTVTPRLLETQCRAQATAQAPRTITTTPIGGVPFTHGYDQHGTICTEARDEIYTTVHNNACYRFDLVINTFCGGEVSGGARDMTPQQLDAIRKRLESILDTVQFDDK